MFNLFRKSHLHKLLKDLQSKDEFFHLDFYRNDGGIALQIYSRDALKGFQAEYDGDKNGFIILFFFQETKKEKPLYFDKLSKSIYYNQFHIFNKNMVDYYILDLKNDIKAVERISLEILRDIFDIKDNLIYPSIFLTKRQ